MTEELQDQEIKNEEQDFKDDLEENDSRYKEHISTKIEVLVKSETDTTTINEFEEMQDWTIKSEKPDMNEDWEENAARSKDHILAPTEVVKVETNQEINDLKEMHEITLKDWEIKNEELDIKEDSEENEASILQDVQVKSEKDTPEISDQLDYDVLLESHFLSKTDHCMDKIVEETSLKMPHLQHKYLEGSKAGFVRQKLKCDQCSYKTKFKSFLKRHRLRHKNPEDVEILRCNTCDFKTMYKESLKRHWIMHNNIDNLELFKCNKCTFQTKYKGNLKYHLRRHINSEGVDMFKCNKCVYQTRHKNNLKPHMRRHHPDHVQNFKCDQCSYKTRFQSFLNRHLLRHRNAEKVRDIEMQ